MIGKASLMDHEKGGWLKPRLSFCLGVFHIYCVPVSEVSGCFHQAFRALQDFGVASYEGGGSNEWTSMMTTRVAETYLPHFKIIAILWGRCKMKEVMSSLSSRLVILFLLLLDLVGGQQNWCLQVKMLCFHLEFKIQWFILFHPYLGKIPIWTNIFQMRLKPPTSFPLHRPLKDHWPVMTIGPFEGTKNRQRSPPETWPCCVGIAQSYAGVFFCKVSKE